MTLGAEPAVVTGGARGIGFAVAERLTRAGYAVVIADQDSERGERAAARLDGTRYLRVDVTAEDDVAALFRRIEADAGGLGVLVNNAAITDPTNPPIESLEPTEWQRRINANLTSAYLCTHFAVPLLRAASGCIVNIASTRALQSEPHCEAYAAAKGGLIALTHALAVSLGPAVRVNAVSPGWIDTSASVTDDKPFPEQLTATDHEQHPVGRIGRPEDVAETVAWLASDAAAFMTGENIVLDGGMSRRMIYAD